MGYLYWDRRINNKNDSIHGVYIQKVDRYPTTNGYITEERMWARRGRTVKNGSGLGPEDTGTEMVLVPCAI